MGSFLIFLGGHRRIKMKVMAQSAYQWQSTQETIDDLVGKISVKRRDNESIFRTQQETIKRNEEHITTLRLAVKEAHQEFARTLNMDFNVIQSAIDSKPIKLECKGYDAYTAIRELNEYVCVEGKRLNHFVHQKECRQRRLYDLRLHYRDYKLLQESNFEKENTKRVRLLMTKLDKMTTKRNTASFLKNTYLKTVGKLKKDALTMHKILNGLEADLNINETELVDLSKIYTSAKKGQEISRANRMALERDVFKHKHVRDATIQDTRKRAKEAADLSDFGTATRAPNDLLGTTTKSNKSNAETTIEKLEKMVPIIEEFSATTNTATAEDIPKAYERQIQHFNYMTEIAKKLEVSLAEKEEERSQLAEKLNSATFQQAENIKAVIEELENVEAKETELEEKTECLKSEAIRTAAVIEKIRDSVVSIYERLHSTKLGPDLNGPPSSTAIDLDNDSVIDILDRLRERTSALHKLVFEKTKTEEPKCADGEDESKNEGCNEVLEAPEPSQEVSRDSVMETMIALKRKYCNNVRITLQDEDELSGGDTFQFDDMNLNECYITREEIKKYGSAAQKMKMKKRKH